MRMVRVSLKGDNYVIMVFKDKGDIPGVELTENQAADVLTQLRLMLPQDKLGVEMGSSDEYDSEEANS
jgi:hypothetical protein